MKQKFKALNNKTLTSAALAAFTLFASTAQAFDVWSQSIVGAGNSAISGSGIGALAFDSHNNSATSTAILNRSWTGLDGNNQSQTMNFQGTTVASSNYGRLHCYTDGTVTNTYHNANNPIFWDGNNYNENGSPDFLVSLGFAGFNDTLHYGGSLQAGYKARYYFHLDGFQSGYGTLADLAFNVDGNPGEGFFETGQGNISTNWVTQSYEINGITPQNIGTQFSTQFVVNTWEVADGSTLSGISDFSSTLVLTGIEVLDANDNPVTGWTVTSDSGTIYEAVPEPASLVALSALAAFVAKRKSKK
ncbi:MAG: PEP-CTERM sorting domain-containing protein [Fimbriimonadaceae bacterium]